VGAAFVHTRRAGGLLIVGLVLNALLPIQLPWALGLAIPPARCGTVAPGAAQPPPIRNGPAADIGRALP
jgi:hypothetical protein